MSLTWATQKEIKNESPIKIGPLALHLENSVAALAETPDRTEQKCVLAAQRCVFWLAHRASCANSA